MGRPSSSFSIGGVLHKKCPACETVKPHDEYAKNKSRAHGIQGICKDCGTARSKQWNANNPERHRANVRRWESENPERVAATSKAYHHVNREKKLIAASRWHLANKSRANEARRERRAMNIEKERARIALAQKINPHVKAAICARRKAIKKNALRPFDQELFKLVESEAYSLSRMRTKSTGIKWNVDHIVPLTSPRRQSLSGDTIPSNLFCGPTFPIVQGFHNEYNLTVITKFENESKSNRYWPNMP